MVAGTMMMSQTPKAKIKFSCDSTKDGKRLTIKDDHQQQESRLHRLASSIGSSIKQQQVLGASEECSMCGDVGFPSELFRCKRCLKRYQHTYCSRFYPNALDQDVCEWCCLGDSSRNCSTSSSNNNIIISDVINNNLVPSRTGSTKRKQPSEVLLGASPVKRIVSSSTSKQNNRLSTKQEQYADALELLLEVAQAVTVEGKKDEAKQNPSLPSIAGINSSSSSKLIIKRPKLQEADDGSKNNSSTSSSKAAIRQQPGNPKKNGNSTRTAAPKLQLSTSRSIGRRYKLLSDVLC